MDEPVAWKGGPRRKPLVLNGARQVGKAWLLKEFGRRRFDNVACVNLDDGPGMREQLEAGYDIPRIVPAIRFETGRAVTEGGALIVPGEMQACPKAPGSPRHFCENAPGHAVAAAGLLMGITVHEGSGCPVGKVGAPDSIPSISGVPRSDGRPGALRPDRLGGRGPDKRPLRQARPLPMLPSPSPFGRKAKIPKAAEYYKDLKALVETASKTICDSVDLPTYCETAGEDSAS